MPAGAIAPWATYNGIDFASYDTTNGVVPLPPDGRPTQVSAAGLDGYVLATDPQTALTGIVVINGVTMNTGGNLDLEGNLLGLAPELKEQPGWISNGTLRDASLSEDSQSF